MNRQNKKYLIKLLYKQLEKVNDYIENNNNYINYDIELLNILSDTKELIKKKIDNFEKEKIKIEKIIKELKNE